MKQQKSTFGIMVGVRLPNLPNFLTLDLGGTVDIAELSDTELLAIGERWTTALVQHATKRRIRK